MPNQEVSVSINSDENTPLLNSRTTNESSIREKSKWVVSSSGSIFNATALALDLGIKTTSGITSVIGKTLKFTSSLIPSRKPIIKGLAEITSGSCLIAGIVYNFTINNSPDNVTTTVPPFITSTQTEGTTTPRSYTNPTPTGYGVLNKQFHEDNIINDGNIYHFYPVILAGASTVLIGVARIGSAANLLSDSNFKKIEVALKGSNFASWGTAGILNIRNQQIISGGLKIAGSLFNLSEIFKKDDLKHDFSIKVLLETEDKTSNFSFIRSAELTGKDIESINEKLESSNCFKTITIRAQKSGKKGCDENIKYDIDNKKNLFSKLGEWSDSEGKGKINSISSTQQRIGASNSSTSSSSLS